MIELMAQSSGTTLGFKISGDVTKQDYSVMDPAVAKAIDASGQVNLLLDMIEFHWEKVNAWRSDLHFGKEYHEKIEKMAIVGDKKWEKHLSTLCTPYYAKASKYFDNDTDAWEWLEN